MVRGRDIFAAGPLDWSEALQPLGAPAFRGRQLYRALQQRQVADWGDVAELPATLRRELAAHPELRPNWPAIAQRARSVDGTVRYLLTLGDGVQVEAVYLPSETFTGEGRDLRRRTTFCLSTQAGCAVNCQFCLTARLGLTRNLTAGEIVSQVLTLLREHSMKPGERERINLVFMGMGEPLLNFDAVVAAIGRLTDPAGAAIAARRITVSTAGMVEKIARFGATAFPHGRPRLAISLNAASDEQRDRLMPINRAQGGLAALLAAARAYPLGEREWVTFEYVLLAGENDAPGDARRLVKLTAGIRCKINLIAWNPGPELPFHSPDAARVAAFQAELRRGGRAAYLRRPRGQDIYAACGQLKKTLAPVMAPASPTPA